MDVSQLPPGLARQFQIYGGGLNGAKPAVPLDLEQLETQAKARLKPEAYDYVAGGAGLERAVRVNQEAFCCWRIVPRMLRDVSKRTLATRLFNQHMPAPVLVAPIGVQGIVHPEGELASARAAASLGLTYILSSASSKTIEEVAAAMGSAPRWFQLYWSRDPDIAQSFLQRAEAAGYSAIVVTLDTMMLGWRHRDLDRAYLPFLRGDGVANYFSDPVFNRKLGQPVTADPQAAIRYFLSIFGHVGYTWPDLAMLRRHTRLPLLVKGILHKEDASLAVDHGVDGIIVSNHGGRQVDGAIAAIEALPKVVEVVRGRVPVLFDSGIRTGADAIKALALGASAVLYGRPWVYGLALAGEVGVREVLANFIADLDVTLGLAGHASPAELSPADLVHQCRLH